MIGKPRTGVDKPGLFQIHTETVLLVHMSMLTIQAPLCIGQHLVHSLLCIGNANVCADAQLLNTCLHHFKQCARL